MDHSIKSFADFLTESGDWRDRVRLAQIGLDEVLRVLKIRVDMDRLGDKKLDGTWMPYMECWFYDNWPLSTEANDSWDVYPDLETSNRFKLEGNSKMVDAVIKEMADDLAADLIWEIPDDTWYEVRTGKNIGKLNLALDLE
jgi:hypothetical protein